MREYVAVATITEYAVLCLRHDAVLMLFTLFITLDFRHDAILPPA